jgi:TonB family protein
MISAFLLSLVELGGDVPAQAPKPTPIAESQWIGADDYPAPAMRAMAEGRVAYRLDVNQAGAVTGCTIVTSSGSDLLDVHTCDLMRLRARFAPAHDAAGNVITSHYESAVNWRLSAGPPFEVTDSWPPDRSTISLKIGTDGRVTECAVVEAAGASAQPNALSPCTKYPPGSRYIDPPVRNGKPVTGRVRITNIDEIEFDQ